MKKLRYIVSGCIGIIKSSQQSTANSQQSTANSQQSPDGATGINITGVETQKNSVS
ncbi:hypothetical protein QT970_12355 [Microcoleus sp. herbarium8]|uniref:hypothetical protein n=1 Tax=Microcoleus sp. herbarium8 TaxID=3055436 RepID=UPI002FD46ED1